MNSSDKILAYLENALSQPERVSLENEINKDPNLKMEFELQNDIIQGIQQVRKAELKAMLNNVPVGGGGIGSNLTVTHYISAAFLTILVGMGVFYLLPDDPENSLSATSNEVTQNTESKEETVDISDVDKASTMVPKEITKKEVEPVAKPEEGILDKPTTEQVENIDIEENTTSLEENLTLAKPSVLESFNTIINDTDKIDIPEHSLLEKSDIESTMVVKIENKFKEFYNHYQFKNNSLILYGDFNDTYEIIDLHKIGKRAIYLYYEGHYHHLSTEQNTIAKLIVVEDSSIITQLDNLRKE